ncbi:MAG TPA: glucoamylase family protein [Fimbriimonadaceae bacterium]|nr:glucoamylase family protein [Fimbriimonadaceae bacterium]
MNETRELDRLQRETFGYFLHEANPANGLVVDKTAPGTPSSIAAVGLALASYPVGVERGFVGRVDAVARTLATLRFFHRSLQSEDANATGYKGFYYHFLDMETGRRAWNSELSTIDTAILLAGALTAAAYFAANGPGEQEIRDLAAELYERADWQWAQNGGLAVSLGWKPECGFLPYRWDGYDEALILYLLGLGSPTHPLPPESFREWTSSYRWRKIYDWEVLHSGPLFTHQISHLWVDFRGIQDETMRAKGSDYFENSRRATYVQRRYAIDNPLEFKAYGRNCWGITASDGPGPDVIEIDGRRREFFGYLARGVPDGPDDGTIAPWAVVASLPFAPEIVLPAIEHFLFDAKLKTSNGYGFTATFNPTHPDTSHNPNGWVSPWHFGVNQGPIVLMIENYRSGLLWELMRANPHLAGGLRRAGFQGGWLAPA